jgi:cyclase
MSSVVSLRPRIIPCLLLDRDTLVKTVRFGNPRYIGDPINVVQIFNDLEVDEVVVLDIGAARGRGEPDPDLVGRIASEGFMPFAYGGGVRSLEDAERMFARGIEKIVLNTAAIETPALVSALARTCGSQAVVASIDARRDSSGAYSTWTRGGARDCGRPPDEVASSMEALGAGEIFIQSIDRDGTYRGYDLELIRRVSGTVTIPVVACGGAGAYSDLATAIHEGGASAAAAGSLFVFQGQDLGVLVNFPSPEELEGLFR